MDRVTPERMDLRVRGVVDEIKGQPPAPGPRHLFNLVVRCDGQRVSVACAMADVERLGLANRLRVGQPIEVSGRLDHNTKNTKGDRCFLNIVQVHHLALGGEVVLAARATVAQPPATNGKISQLDTLATTPLDPLEEMVDDATDAAPAWLPPPPTDPQHRPLYQALRDAHAAGEGAVSVDRVAERARVERSRVAERLGQGMTSGWCFRDGDGWRLRRADDPVLDGRTGTPPPRDWDPPQGVSPTREAEDRAVMDFFDSLGKAR